MGWTTSRGAGRLAATLALCASGAAHALVFSGLAPAPAPEAAAGGAGAEVALLGNDFADMVAGTAQPVAPAAALAPAAVPLATPAAADLPLLTPVVTETAPLAPRAEATPPETRPKPRPKPEPEPRAEAAPAKTAPAKAVPQGSGAREARRGVETGAAQGSAAVAQGRAGSAAAAPAGASSPERYAAAVIRKIRATPQRAAGGRGRAVVGFEIGASGAIATLRIVKSSGSAALDAAALDHIRRAAPFPPPPAQPARYSFEFVARG